MPKRSRAGQQPRSKEARNIVRAVAKAGGTWERTGKGHLRIQGPKGIAFIASDPGSNRLATAIETVESQTGLKLEL
jgi:hypothetical protein